MPEKQSAKPIVLNEDSTIKWGNALVSGRWNVTAVEFRLLITLTSQIERGLNEFDFYEVPVASLGKMMQIETNSYRDIKKITDSLFNKYVIFRLKPTSDSKEIWVKSHWFSDLGYDESRAVLMWKFNQKLVPLLLNLRKAYVRTKALPVMNFRSSYAGRWYLLAQQWRKLDNVIMTVDDVRQMFELGKKHKLFADFYRSVIEIPIKEVNACSDFNLIVTPIKTGRKYTHLKFTVQIKTVSNSESIADTQVIF